jgi:ribonucleoside-diphosphate reductase alpha chain
MLRLEETNFEIQEVVHEEVLDNTAEHVADRPGIVDAKVYKLRSGFVKHSVYITLGYIEENGRKRPIEIFINSKDLTKNAEYAVLTRLISAIFRKTASPAFILEELSSIHDPNGGYHRNGKYIHSFYSEIATVIEQFFKEIGVTESNEDKTPLSTQINAALASAEPPTTSDDMNVQYYMCPDCSQKSVKMENGCLTCVNPECGYSKCDK